MNNGTLKAQAEKTQPDDAAVDVSNAATGANLPVNLGIIAN